MNSTTLTFQYPKPPCILITRTTNTDGRKQALTVVYVTYIPLIITVNLLSIIGIIQTKLKKLNSSQVLFLTLFVSDLTTGALQLPLQMYVLWTTNDITCFELQLSMFSTAFPMLMSGSLLCVISIDRYINVVSNTYYRRFVTKKSLSVTIILVMVVSFIWATFETLFLAGVDKGKVAKGYIALATYCAAELVIAVTLNVALLINVKSQVKNSTTRQTINLRLTKTIAMIVATLVAAYVPAIVTLFILAHAVINSTDINFLYNIINVFYWTLTLVQLNAVINSVIYLTRNSHIKKYYGDLFNCGKAAKNLQNTDSTTPI